MKRKILLFVITISAAFSLHAQTVPDAEKLTAMLNEFLAGAGRNDVAIHDRFWADDLIYTRSAGVRINKEDLMKGVRSATAPKAGEPVTVYTAEDIRIQQYGDAAVVAFRLVITATKADGAKTVSNNLNTGTFIRRKGKWQAVSWQSTIVPKPEAAAQAETQPTSAKPASLAATPAAPSTGTRTYIKGSRGGCYYLNGSGNKVYVDHKYCN